jgi:hypothetical protein
MLKDHEQLLDDAIQYMRDLEPVLELALTHEAETEYEHDIAFANAMDHTKESNADKRKAEAVLVAQQQLKAYLKAKSASKMIQIKMKNAQQATSAYQSLLRRTE